MPSPPKRLIRALNGETLDRPPFWLMRQAGRYLPEYRATRAKAKGFIELCLSPDLAAEITLQPLRRFAMDAAILFSDILIVPHAIGQKVEFHEGVGPVLEPIRSAADIDRLSAGLSDAPVRYAPVLETVRRVVAALPAETAMIGFAGAPWTVAAYMVEGRGSRDYAAARLFAYREPEAFGRLIDLVVAATIEYLSAQIAAGAEAVQLFDSWAGVLPEAEFERWCVRPTAAIVAALKARHATTPIVGFPRGAGILYRGYARATGVDAVGLDTSVPLDWAAEAVQPGAPVQGNLDPLALVCGGATMTRAAERILRGLGRGPFVFNLGHGIVPETPVSHVAALSASIRGWRG